MECLKLTVRELSHIRQVFSRAEIEKYHAQNELYKLLSKDKVRFTVFKLSKNVFQICFNCKIKKFNFLVWAYQCDICKAKVCVKCLRKVRHYKV